MAMPQPPPSSPPRPGKGAVFLRRLTSTVLLWGVILAALFSGRPLLSQAVFVLIMLILAVVGVREFYALARQAGLVCFSGWGTAGTVLLVTGVFLNLTGRLGPHDTAGAVNDFESGFLVLFVLGLGVRQLWARDNPHGIQAVATTLLGLMFVPWLLNFIQKIYFLEGVQGAFYLLYFIAVTKLSDTGAYLVGSLCGRHKMIPRISPGKTWEGFAGAIVVSTGASVAFAVLAGEHLSGFGVGHAVLLGLILSVSAVTGDLIESLFKREAKIKDSGRTFPGIGGILNLTDSLLFNAPLMYLYMRYVLALPHAAEAGGKVVLP